MAIFGKHAEVFASPLCPRVIVSREALEDNGIRVTTEWVVGDGPRQEQIVTLASDELTKCELRRSVPLNEQWRVDLFQHPRAGRKSILASLKAVDVSASMGLTIVDRDTEFVAIEVGVDGTARRFDDLPTCRPFRSDVRPLRDRRLRLLRDPPTDDTGAPQNLPPGTTDVVVDADAVGPGLTVRVRLPDDSTQIAYVTFDQLAVYESGR